MTHIVRVWIGPVSADLAADGERLLDDRERARADTYLRASDRQQYTFAHAVLRIVAGEVLDVAPAQLSWVPSGHGKPQLAPPWSELHTSLSHSGDMIAVAVSTGRSVGIDIQHLIPEMDTVGMSRRFFAPDEAKYVAAVDNPDARADRFAYLWSRKEAVVKAVGGRLWPNLRMPVRNADVVSCIEPASFYRIADLPAPAGYRAAVALQDTEPFAVETVSF